MVTTILLALAVAAAVALPPVFMKGSFSEVFGGSKGSTEATGEEAEKGSSAVGITIRMQMYWLLQIRWFCKRYYGTDRPCRV